MWSRMSARIVRERWSEATRPYTLACWHLQTVFIYVYAALTDYWHTTKLVRGWVMCGELLNLTVENMRNVLVNLQFVARNNLKVKDKVPAHAMKAYVGADWRYGSTRS